MKKYNIYLDDVRTPLPNPSTHDTPEWTVVRSYNEFVEAIMDIGLENIDLISLDHDLDDTAIMEWHTNVYHNSQLNYENIREKTGMDCAKWLVEQWKKGAPVCRVMVHSANAIGSGNIMGYINNYKHINRLPQDCVRWQVPHSIETIID